MTEDLVTHIRASDLQKGQVIEWQNEQWVNSRMIVLGVFWINDETVGVYMVESKTLHDFTRSWKPSIYGFPMEFSFILLEEALS